MYYDYDTIYTPASKIQVFKTRHTIVSSIFLKFRDTSNNHKVISKNVFPNYHYRDFSNTR